MNKNILNEIEGLKDEVSSEYTDITYQVNNLTTSTYNTINQTTTEVTTIKDKLAVISDMFTDLRVLNGTAKNITYLSTLPVVSSKNISIKNDKFTLKNSVTVQKEISTSKSSISSLEKYSLLNSDEKSTILDDILTTNIDTTIQFPTNRYTFNLNIRYDNVEQVNNIELKLGLNTESYPIISSIKYIDTNNIEQQALILNNKDKSYDLDYNREKDNEYSLDISPIVTNQIIIEFTSKDTSSLTMNSVKTFFKREAEEGEMILGPVQTNDPLLKIGLDTTELTEGCTFEFSTDLDYWLKIESSSIITDETNTKILSFNTINDKSIKTTEDIYTFYIKIMLKSKVITNDDVDVNLYNIHREDTTLKTSTLEIVDNNLISVYKVKNSDFIYGEYQYINSVNLKDFERNRLEYAEVNGVSKVLGLIDTPYSLTENTTITSGGIGAELKLKRLSASNVHSSRNIDLANSVVYDIYLRDIEETININEKNTLCLVLKHKKPKIIDIYSEPTDVEFFVKPYLLEFTSSSYDLEYTSNAYSGEFTSQPYNLKYTKQIFDLTFTTQPYGLVVSDKPVFNLEYNSQPYNLTIEETK